MVNLFFKQNTRDYSFLLSSCLVLSSRHRRPRRPHLSSQNVYKDVQCFIFLDLAYTLPLASPPLAFGMKNILLDVHLLYKKRQRALKGMMKNPRNFLIGSEDDFQDDFKTKFLYFFCFFVFFLFAPASALCFLDKRTNERFQFKRHICIYL